MAIFHLVKPEWSKSMYLTFLKRVKPYAFVRMWGKIYWKVNE